MNASIGDVRSRQREILARARPIDRRVDPDRWSAADFAGVTRTQMLSSFWGSDVPGSGAYDEMLTGAVVAADHLGWSTDSACEALSVGWRAVEAGETVERRAALADAVFDALESGRRRMPVEPALADALSGPHRCAVTDLDARMLASWQGKIAGGAFGTALEGCRGAAIEAVYGRVRSYVAPPSTLNDDVVYELVALDVLDSCGAAATIDDYSRAWSARIPFGWSAEWVALDNLQRAMRPSVAATVRNPMVSWIGAQMRGMVFGQLAPGQPAFAGGLARTEASVSHRGDGVEGGVFAAIISALSFVHDDPRALAIDAVGHLGPSSYRNTVREIIEWCAASATFDDVWPNIAARFPDENWIHALPNIGAVIASLWFGGGDITESFSLVARAGLDVDCNAGLVGTILGAMTASVPDSWSEPLADRIDTYLPDLATVRITDVAERTLRVGARLMH